MIAIAGAMTLFIPNNYSCNQLNRIKEAFNLSLRAIMVLCSVIVVLYILLFPWLFPPFTSIVNVIDLARKQVLIGSFFQATAHLPVVIYPVY